MIAFTLLVYLYNFQKYQLMAITPPVSLSLITYSYPWFYYLLTFLIYIGETITYHII